MNCKAPYKIDQAASGSLCITSQFKLLNICLKWEPSISIQAEEQKFLTRERESERELIMFFLKKITVKNAFLSTPLTWLFLSTNSDTFIENNLNALVLSTATGKYNCENKALIYYVLITSDTINRTGHIIHFIVLPITNN